MNYVVRHKGIVTAISPDGKSVDLRVSDTDSDCGGCALRGLCSTRTKDDSVSITATIGDSPVEIGSTIEVALPERTRWLASIVILMVPVTIFVATLLTTLALGRSEGTAAVVAIVLTSLYFTALIPLRGRLASRSRWRVVSG